MAEDPIETLRADPTLRPLIETHGSVCIEPAGDFFERFIISILRQQVSMSSAAAIRNRLFDAIDVTPSGVLDANVETLRNAGLSRQKTSYVRNVAEAFEERGYARSYFEDMDDESVRAELTSITGVGTWTADMQLIFSLGREDVFPVGDLGIRTGMQTLFTDDMTRAEMVERAQRWAPYRSYASQYIWRVVDDEAT